MGGSPFLTSRAWHQDPQILESFALPFAGFIFILASRQRLIHLLVSRVCVGRLNSSGGNCRDYRDAEDTLSNKVLGS